MTHSDGDKLDTGARYTIAGTDWTQKGERKRGAAPVDFVEGIGGFLLDVLGVWTFTMHNTFAQVVPVDAGSVDGCTDEFFIGVDFMKRHKASLDFDRSEVRSDEKWRMVVIPFRTNDEDVMTKTKVGKSWVPAINIRGDKATPPGRRKLGVWIPRDNDLEVLGLGGVMQPAKIIDWLAELDDTTTPLENENEVRVGTEDSTAGDLMIRLLRAYRPLSTHQGNCTPATV
ncbi:unnamed protein product [Phytophthora fragariaefolia]|uniref:Unnamed protein product n=1 Tax=Phytophthora fragariaefolia TaxID=1490495 RepID=A0A9W7D508_9STRA|nr:unnamed protein product [Phytophthora fragariaefolia]